MTADPRYVRRSNFVTRRIAGETVVVPVMAAVDDVPNADRLDFLVLNESGEVLWQRLSAAATMPELAHELITTYGIAPEAARDDAAAFVASLLEIHALDETR